MRRALVFVAILAAWLGQSGVVQADGCVGQATCEVHANHNALTVDIEVEAQANGEVAVGEVSMTDLASLGLDAICVNAALSGGHNPFTFCGLTDDGELPELTPGIVASAFRRIPLPGSRLLVQPPNGRTLVNFETNFYTDNGPFEVPAFVLLGHRIELRVRPVEFVWDFGDGSSQVTTSPGAAYPRLDVTHSYRRVGRVRPSVTTVYAASYRVDGDGPWREVDGTVRIVGEAVEVEVLSATPTLVGYR